LIGAAPLKLILTKWRKINLHSRSRRESFLPTFLRGNCLTLYIFLLYIYPHHRGFCTPCVNWKHLGLSFPLLKALVLWECYLDSFSAKGAIVVCFLISIQNLYKTCFSCCQDRPRKHKVLGITYPFTLKIAIIDIDWHGIVCS